MEKLSLDFEGKRGDGYRFPWPTVITSVGWEAIFGFFACSRLAKLNLGNGSNITDNCAKLLANSLINNNSNMKELKIRSCRSVTSQGWMSFAPALQSSACMLEILSITGNELGGGVHMIAFALSTNRTLRILDLSDNHITNGEIASFQMAFMNPNSALEHLILSGNENVVESTRNLLADKLVNNDKLKYLSMPWSRSYHSTTEDKFLQLLCNKSSIMDTYMSNHTLCDVGSTQYSSELWDFIRLNRNNDPSSAARLKIIQTHFSTLNVGPFLDMNWKIFPQAIAWMARDDQGLALLYRFLQSTALSASDSYGAPTSDTKKQKLSSHWLLGCTIS